MARKAPTNSAAAHFRAPKTIFWVAFALRVLCIVIGHTYRIRVPMDHFGFGWEMGRIARSLTLGQGYANPFNGPSGPTAWTPPLYPLLMALSFRLFGIYTNAAACFLLICNSLFSALIAPAVYEIAARCFDAYGLVRRRSANIQPVALWSAWLWAVYPAALQYAIHWIWEMSLSTCLFTWMLVFALRLRRIGDNLRNGFAPRLQEAFPWKAWSCYGVLWGLLALSNASLLLCLPAITLWILWPELKAFLRSPQALRASLPGAALSVALTIAVMTPWIIRNEIALHAFIPTRSNLGVELYESSLPSHDALPWGTAMPLWAGDPEFQRYVRLGEAQYSRIRGEEAKARLRAEPARFWHWTMDRFLYFWDGTPHPPEKHPMQEYFRNLSYSFLSLCGLLGLALAIKQRAPGAMLFAIAFALVPLPYYLVTVQPRFRHPLEPLIAILGVYLFRSAVTTSKA